MAAPIVTPKTNDSNETVVSDPTRLLTSVVKSTFPFV